MSTAQSELPQAPGQAARPPLRFVTAASLFDGHDAAINIMRRLIQAQGAEVIHLGHNRSVDDIVRAAIQEESLYYESKKHDGTYPLIGVNTFLPKEGQEDEVHDLEFIRSTESEKQDQITHAQEFRELHRAELRDPWPDCRRSSGHAAMCSRN